MTFLFFSLYIYKIYLKSYILLNFDLIIKYIFILIKNKIILNLNNITIIS